MNQPDRKNLDSIADGVMETVPVFFKRLVRGVEHPPAGRFGQRKIVLMVVRMHGPSRMSTIARHLGLSRPHMTALVDSLIDEGLVERIPDPDDRRAINIKITSKGEEMTEEFLKSARRTVIRNLSALDREDISSLHEIVRRIRTINAKLEAQQYGKTQTRGE